VSFGQYPPPSSPMYRDSAQPVDEGEVLAEAKRVQIRSDHAVLVSVAQLLEEMLAELKALTARAAAGESRSSATIKTSARGVDLEVKSYADGLLPDAIGDALAGYARGQRELVELQARQWQATVR